MQHKHSIHLFFWFSIPLNFFVTYSLVHCSIVLILLAITTTLQETYLWGVKATLVPVKRWDGHGSEIRGKRAKVASTHVIADRKFRPSGISGGRSRAPVTFPRDLSPEVPDGWNFPTAITHVPATFARFHLVSVPSPSNFLVVKCHFDITH